MSQKQFISEPWNRYVGYKEQHFDKRYCCCSNDLVFPYSYSTSIASIDIDYNHYWSRDVATTFKDSGVTKTWDQWQALGYDVHSDTVQSPLRVLGELILATMLYHQVLL